MVVNETTKPKLMWDYDRMEFVPCTFGSKTGLTAGPSVAAVPLHSTGTFNRSRSPKKRRASRKDKTQKKVRRSLDLSETKNKKSTQPKKVLRRSPRKRPTKKKSR